MIFILIMIILRTMKMTTTNLIMMMMTKAQVSWIQPTLEWLFPVTRIWKEIGMEHNDVDIEH